jgi:hypothetical protein
VGGLDDASVVSTYSRVSGMPGGKHDPSDEEIRAKSMASALDWLRTNDLPVADLDSFIHDCWSNEDGQRTGQEKDQALDWLRKIGEVTTIPCLRCQKCSSGPMSYQKLKFGQNRLQALWTGSGTIKLTMSRPTTRQLHLTVSLVLAVSVASFMTVGAMKMGSAQDKRKTKRWTGSGRIGEVTTIPCLRCQTC